jgi:predicted Zn-dependent protease with MMP-like domain
MRRTANPFGRSPFRPSMDRARFEELVGEALAEIPKGFRKLIDNVTVMVEDDCPPGTSLLGLYHGVPYPHRSPGSYGNLPPDVIVIYQRPIESISRTDEDIKDNVRDTVLHEVGHYFGLGEAELREIERAIRESRRGERH